MKEKTKGTYVLLIKLKKSKIINVGKLGKFKFPKGFYVYVGSAFGSGGLKSRVERHLKKEKKKRWHIDYFLELAKIIDVFTTNERCEKKLASELLKFGECVAKRFGSTDDQENETHLIFFDEKSFDYGHFKKIVVNSMKKFGRIKAFLKALLRRDL